MQFQYYWVPFSRNSVVLITARRNWMERFQQKVILNLVKSHNGLKLI